MPTTFGNPNYQRKFDALRIVHESGCEPLQKAIEVALQMRSSAELIQKAMDGAVKPETRAQLTIALTKVLPDQFHAWIKVAEFVYAKPRQQIEVGGTLTLEQVLAASLGKTVDTHALPQPE